MRYIYIIFLSVILLSCDKEESLEADLKVDPRVETFDTLSSDYSLKVISKYYYDYDKFLILDADTTDYFYNINTSNSSYSIGSYDLTESDRKDRVDLFKEFFLDRYPEEFIKNAFPLKFIIADSINFVIQGMSIPQSTYASTFCFAVKHVDLSEISAEEKQSVYLEYQLSLLKCIGMVPGRFVLSSSFYSYNGDLYGKMWGNPLSIEELYEKGFVKDMTNRPGFYSMYPTMEEDFESWIEFLFVKPETEIQDIISQYDFMKLKYDLLVKAFTDHGVDYKDLKI